MYIVLMLLSQYPIIFQKLKISAHKNTLHKTAYIHQFLRGILNFELLLVADKQ